MTHYKWAGWKKRNAKTSHKSPYIDWFETTGGTQSELRGASRFSNREDTPEGLIFPEISSDKFTGSNITLKSRKKTPEPSFDYEEFLKAALRQIYGPHATRPPIPVSALTGQYVDDEFDHSIFASHISKHGPLPEILQPESTTPLPESLKTTPDTVIMGIIDVGIPLGHRHSRFKDGTTRFLGAWQMSADRRDLNPDPALGRPGRQLYVPFGRELLANEINAELMKHTPSGDIKTGWLDETAFNRSTFSEDPQSLHGNRELGRQKAHGAFVLDTAAGVNATADPDLASQFRILAINLPRRELIGHSAENLEFYSLHGILRLVAISDAIWQRNQPKSGLREEDKKGHHLVINLSFGMQASGRDGFDMTAELIRKLNEKREEAGYHPIHLSIPAGNENLSQSHIYTRLGEGVKTELQWRIAPSDQSANFVEIWTNELKDIAQDDKVPLAIEVIAPNGKSLGVSQGKHGHSNDLETDDKTAVARIYCDVMKAERKLDIKSTTQEHPETGTQRKRIRYLIAVKQTNLYEQTALAPSGLWTIKLRNILDKPMRLRMDIQTDQSVHHLATGNLRSTFEDRDYERYDETGRVIDSYDYPYDKSKPKATDSSNLVRRHGTITAIGISSHTATVAGHRQSDGRMAPESGTGIRIREDDTTLRSGPKHPIRKKVSKPTASMTIRDGAAHFGTLASGSTDGSSVAMEGTSFAAARMSRYIVMSLLRPHFVKSDVIKEIEEAAKSEEAKELFSGRAAQLKMGAGRLNPDADDSPSIRVHRSPKYPTR